jgi:hypothetical protein
MLFISKKVTRGSSFGVEIFGGSFLFSAWGFIKEIETGYTK